MEVSIKMTDKELNRNKPLNIPKVKGKKINKRNIILILVSLLVISVLSLLIYFVYKGYQATKDIGFQFSPGQLIEKKKEPELKKDSTGKYTNVLLVGIDTRENTQLLNTDVIIVGSYNHETKDILFLSIPRDFNAQTHLDKVWFNKINSTYMVNEKKEEGSGLPTLQKVVEGITGLEIQYYAMIDFKGFVSLIDAVGGVYVNVENSFTDYRYPKGSGYQTVSFKAGPQLMNGETALQYSRSRHSQQNGEGSDYARARRQQKVMDAFKETVLSTETLLNPTKMMALFSSVQNNLKVSEFTVEDIQAGINILRDMKGENNSTTYSFVLDPTAGNYSLVGESPTGGYSIAPKEGLGKYSKINEYIQLILTYPSLYSENPSIYIYDAGLGYQNTYQKTQDFRNKYKYLNIRFMGSKFSNKEDIYVFTQKTDEFTPSISIVANYFNTENISKPEYVTTGLNKEDISVMIGKEVVKETVTTEENI